MSNGKINKLEIVMAQLKTNIEYIRESLVKNDNQHKEIINKIDSFVQSADDRFAAKKDHRDTIQKIDNLETTIDNNFVTKEEFTPVRKVVYSLVGAILLAFFGAIVALIFR